MKYFSFLIVLASTLFLGWGNDGHKIISGNTTLSFTASMSYLLSWKDTLIFYCSEADYRKSDDPDESPRHYINVDDYPEFISTGKIPQTLDSVIAIHGSYFVYEQGVLPYTIISVYDSIKINLINHNWHRAMLLAADLGHYVGDLFMPLHITRNYNGQFTNQNGVHSRFETSMIKRYKSEIVYGGDSIAHIENVRDYVFSTLYSNYSYVDSVLYADSLAKVLAGGTTSGNVYYQKLWDLSKYFTIRIFKDASKTLAELLYSAWIDAGCPTPTSIELVEESINSFLLYPNFPNPFNSTTTLKFRINSPSNVKLKIYDILGNEIISPIDGFLDKGDYQYRFDAYNLFSGTYFYRLESGNKSLTGKMIYLK